MEVVTFTDHESLSHAAAEHITNRLRDKPNLLLCSASGGTPSRTYELLSEYHDAETMLFTQMRLIKLDEWGGLPMDDPATCEAHLQATLVQPLQLAERYIAFQSDAPPQAECDRIAEWLRGNGPIDLCILGLGLNGHLGFNEPADALQTHAHVASLSRTSLSHSMLTQSTRRPTHGLTLGMADLLQARELLLLVSGDSKRGPLSRLMTQNITTQFPASWIWLHANANLFCDNAARAFL